MDWPFTHAYNLALGRHFGLPVYFSWIDGGFEAEMLKNNSYSRAHYMETPDGLVKLERDVTRAKPGTRMRFPQQSASLSTRWCSSLKIDVARRALNNQPRFNGKKVLFVTGERREVMQIAQSTSRWKDTLATDATGSWPGTWMRGERYWVGMSSRFGKSCSATTYLRQCHTAWAGAAARAASASTTTTTSGPRLPCISRNRFQRSVATKNNLAPPFLGRESGWIRGHSAEKH